MFRRSIFLLPFIFMSIAGCADLSRPQLKIDRYIFEYPSPKGPGGRKVNVVIKIRRFSVTAAYNHDRIVYRERNYQRKSYNYHRWMINPADMVTDFLTRDFRASSVYRAVLRYDSQEWPNYEIEGGISEIYEEDSKDEWFAVLTLSVSLIKAREGDITKRLLFQREYRFKEPCKERSPKAVVDAMSRAMARFSEALQRDVYQALLQKEAY